MKGLVSTIDIRPQSIDNSDYENATIVHDMNQPLPEQLKGKFSVVVDVGTLEHVFNYPMAIKNSMELLQSGGFFISATPANNFMGHGFYQFSPELFFSLKRLLKSVPGMKPLVRKIRYFRKPIFPKRDYTPFNPFH